MNVLIIYPHLLYDNIPHGSGVRITRLINELCARKHNIYLVSIAEYDKNPEKYKYSHIKEICKEYKIFKRKRNSIFRKVINSLLTDTPPRVRSQLNPDAQIYVEELTSSGVIDVVYLVFTIAGAYLNSVDRTKSVVILDADDIQTRRHTIRLQEKPRLQQRLQAAYVLQKMREYEHDLIQIVDHVVTITPQEADFINQLCHDVEVTVIPPMIDTKYFHKLPYHTNDNNILYLGSFSNPPNVDAMTWFCSEVLPKVWERIPDAHLYIVGSHSSEQVGHLSNANVTVVGFVEDVRDWIETAAITVTPVRSGGGVRMKNLETMASGRPLVSTTLGAEGLGGQPGASGYLLAENEKDFADQITDLLVDQDKIKQLGESAREMVVQYHDIQVVTSRFEECLRSILNSSN